ncbi:MAG: response regulator [Bacteroidetes bacterium]|nr:response regulator [Bacteroidota bacterium]
MIPTILVVDDVEDVIPLFNQMFKTELKNKLFEFVFKLSSIEVIDYIKSVPTGTISLVMSDIKMPDKDGIELLQDLKKESNIPVFLFSAYDEEVNRRAAQTFAADKFFTKPINFAELREEILKIIPSKQ